MCYYSTISYLKELNLKDAPNLLTEITLKHPVSPTNDFPYTLKFWQSFKGMVFKHVSVTRSFLANPQAYLHHLLQDDDE